MDLRSIFSRTRTVWALKIEEHAPDKMRLKNFTWSLLGLAVTLGVVGFILAATSVAGDNHNYIFGGLLVLAGGICGLFVGTQELTLDKTTGQGLFTHSRKVMSVNRSFALTNVVAVVAEPRLRQRNTNRNNNTNRNQKEVRTRYHLQLKEGDMITLGETRISASGLSISMGETPDFVKAVANFLAVELTSTGMFGDRNRVTLG